MRTLAAVLLASLASAACYTISKAPEGSPRVEVELAVVIDEAFFDPMTRVDHRDELEQAIHDVVLSHADLGLRFYPVPAAHYEGGQEHPEYTLTVQVRAFTPEFDNTMIEEEGREPWIETTVQNVVCTVDSSVERRRENAPPLIVGTSSSDGKVRAEKDPEVIFSGPNYALKQGSGTDAPLRVTRADLLLALDRAVVKALKQLEEPVDREFAPVLPSAG